MSRAAFFLSLVRSGQPTGPTGPTGPVLPPDYTATFQQFGSAGKPVGLSIPLPAGNTGTTLLFMMRLDDGVSGGGYIGYLDGTAALPDIYFLNSGLNAGENYGVAYHDGQRETTQANSPANYNDPGLWVRWTIAPKSLTRTAGYIRFNFYNAQNVAYADIRVYDRVLSAAEIADYQHPPADMLSWYTFANQAAQGNVVTDQTGNGRNATLIT